VARSCIFALALAVGIAGCGGDSDGSASDTGEARRAERGVTARLPAGGDVPEPRISELDPAARAADCDLRSTRARSREHTTSLYERIDYHTNPPTTGRHFHASAEDGIYEEAAPDSAIVHSLEHGRVVIWFKPGVPAEARAGLRALVEQDGHQILLIPRSDMPFDVAATAWNNSPGPEGTGRLLGCPDFGGAVYDALRAFRDEHRGRGPEVAP
jgi:Protein of unknown function (DUF3105)